MSKFNPPARVNPTATTNKAGGQAFEQSPKLKLVSLLLTWFVNAQFYRSEKTGDKELKQAIEQVDPEFAAKAAIFARTRWGEGMRSVTHLTAAYIAKTATGKPWARKFYYSIVKRLDDIMEILSVHLSTKPNGKARNPIPNAMKRGFRDALGKFDAYQMAKYRKEGHGLSLLDVVRLLHPKPNERNAEAFKQLREGKLKNTQTWEATVSAAGQTATTAAEKQEAKGQAWKQMVTSKKLGYMALLKNLRNIADTNDEETVRAACEQLTDAKQIEKAGLFPFRYLIAYDELLKATGTESTRNMLVAISEAIEVSMSNIPKLSGKTLVVLDVSSSMTSGKVAGSNLNTAEAGALFAASMLKAWRCDFITFDGAARYVSYNPIDPLLTMTRGFRFIGGSTNFHTIFSAANKPYDNIVIISDMQGWAGRNYTQPPSAALATYRQQYKVKTRVYSWDMAGYGTMQFPEDRVFALAGFSDQNFEVMTLLQEDPNALVHEIEAIKL